MATSIVSMLSEESKHEPNESSMSQGFSGGFRGLDGREEMHGWRGGGGVIFSGTGEKNHKWLAARSTPPSK